MVCPLSSYPKKPSKGLDINHRSVGWRRISIRPPLARSRSRRRLSTIRLDWLGELDAPLVVGRGDHRHGSVSAILEDVSTVPRARHLLRAKDLMDCRYFEALNVPVLASAARLSPAHFSREFRRTFGETPHHYLLTRRLERAAALLRNTDRKVADICVSVGLDSVGSFTTSFSRYFGCSPTVYRKKFPPAAERARIPACVVQAWGRPQKDSSFREDNAKQTV